MPGTVVERLFNVLRNQITRQKLLQILAAGYGLGLPRGQDSVVARKRKRQKPKPNAFGCLDVGKACVGKSARCCSGICQGKKPKKGKRDRSKCVPHNTGGCQPDQDICRTGRIECGENGFCFVTTGKAPFCTAGGGECRVCAKDTDCQAEFGPGAACLFCVDSCDDTGSTLCHPPAPGAP
jgi:hypothetical protein